MSYSYRPRYQQPPQPVKMEEIHKITIKEISRLGEEIAKIHRFMIFVPNTISNKVNIQITKHLQAMLQQMGFNRGSLV